MNPKQTRPLALIILDGWGISQSKERNAIAMAYTPYYTQISAAYPKTILAAAGEAVGLSRGVPGNAEVGHLNLGAGRVVQTDVSRIGRAIRTGDFFENVILQNGFRRASEKRKPVHFIGLLSDGGVHSSSDTLYALLRMAKREGVQDVFVHGIVDGRDVPPRTADIYVEALEIKMGDIGVGKIATLCGRFFAMDSNENWERTARAFTMLVHNEGERAFDATTAIRSSFLRGIADEFIAPIVLESEPDVPVATICEGDTVIFFNHRADTMRQLVRALAVPDHGSAAVFAKPKLDVVCLTEYERSFNLPVAFRAESGGSSLNTVFAEHGITNYRVAETDRFTHVTRFLNGGTEAQNQFQQNVHIPADKLSARDAAPEMGSFRVTDRFLRGIEADPEGVFVVNLSASDLVAETGNLEKTIEAVQFVDTCLGGILEKVREVDGVAILTSTHGNCEEIDEASENSFNRTTTINPVPFHLIDGHQQNVELGKGGSICDIAPTILSILGLEKPSEMTGVDLRRP